MTRSRDNADNWAGDISGVTAGTGLTGGGTSGAVTLNVDTTTIQTRVAGVSDTEIGYLDGVTSAIQTQLDGKQAIVAGVDSTEIGYLNGVTSAIQTQLDSKAALNLTTNAQAGSYTLVLADNGRIVELSGGGTLTVPTNAVAAFPIGSQVNLLQTGASQVTIAGSGGVTVNATPGLKLRAQWSSATLIKRGTDTWVLVGDLSA